MKGKLTLLVMKLRFEAVYNIDPSVSIPYSSSLFIASRRKSEVVSG